MFSVNAPGPVTTITVAEPDGKMRFWRNTSVATLPTGGSATFGTGILGYEWDEDLDNGARPAGLMRLSSATLSVAQKLQDYGSTYAWTQGQSKPSIRNAANLLNRSVTLSRSTIPLLLHLVVNIAPT